MGQCGSNSVVEPMSVVTAQQYQRTRFTWNRYPELSVAIEDHPQGPTDEEVDLIRNSEENQLQPEDPTKLPLLALAKDYDEWFRCLIKRCDPGVTWMEQGREISLETALYGFGERYDLWCTHMNKWVDKHETNINAPPRTADDKWWWAEFGSVAIVLGLTTAAAVTTSLGGAAAAFPVAAVGHLVWTAIKKWHTSFNDYGPSVELNELFAKSAKVLGSMLGELNTRIKESEEAPRTNTRENDWQHAQINRVHLLQTLLEEDAKEMDRIAQSPASNKTKSEQMMKLLRDLAEFQRQRHEELRQERMVVSLESINEGINDLRSLINDRLDMSMSGAAERTFSELTVRQSSVLTTGSSTHGSTLDSTRTGASAFSLSAR